jgi:hypothetical protein
VVENLLGAIEIVPARASGKMRVAARVVAEAKDAAEAAALAESIRLEQTNAGGETRFHVAFPVEQHAAFRPPAAGIKGVIGRWATPLLRDASSVDYDGRSVQVGPDRKAAGLAVYLTVELPFDVRASVRQLVGSIDGDALRGTLRLETISGEIRMEGCYGSIEAVSANGALTVRRFQGSTLDLRTDNAAVDLRMVRVEHARLATRLGSITGSDVSTGELVVEGGDGDVHLEGVESKTAQIATTAGSIELATLLKGARGASIRTDTGDVTLRVGDLAHFDLAAETKSGTVKTLATELEVVGQEGRWARLRRGNGGAKLDVAAPQGNVTVRPYEGNRLQLLVRERR